MRLSNQRSVKDRPAQQCLPNFWETVRRIQIALGLSQKSILEILSLTERNFRALKARNADPSVSSAMALSKTLNVGFDSLVLNQIDYIALAVQYNGNRAYVPEKYSVGAYSKRRAVIPLLNYMETRFGWEKRASILRDFQMTESMFADPDAPVNLRLGVDLANALYQLHPSYEIVFDMGKSSVRANQNSDMGRVLSGSKTAKESYELMFGELTEKFIERNFRWVLFSASPYLCVVSGTPDPDLMEILGGRYFKDHVACIYRKGFIASIPMYAGMHPAIVSKTACIAQGDPACRYEANIEPALFQKRKTEQGLQGYRD